MSLIEVVVVLGIIVMLSGVMFSIFNGLVARSASITSASAANHLVRTLLMRQQLGLAGMDKFESLLEAPNMVYSLLPAGSRSQLLANDLNPPERHALRNAGITTSWLHDSSATGPVTWRTVMATKAFDGFDVGSTADDVASLNLSMIDPDDLFGRGTVKGTPHEHFLVFGVGPTCSLIGIDNGIPEAPSVGGGDSETQPADRYQRLGVVYRLDRQDTPQVRFLGVVVFTATGLKMPGTQASGWWR